MADNVTTTTTVSTVPSGTVIAADDVGGALYQRVKLSLGADGTVGDAAVGAGTEAGVLRVTLPTDGTGKIGTIGAVVPGTGATNLGKAEDAAHTTGDVGVMALSVRQNTAAALSGTDADYQPLITDGSGRLHVTNSGGVGGPVAHDAADSGNPIGVGLNARTTNPTAVADGDKVRAIGDDIGRQVMVVGQVRDLVTHAHTQIASSSSETTILSAAGAGVFHDLVQLVITNQTATAVNVTIKDDTAGTTRMIIALAASGGAVLSFPRPVNQAVANKPWTATLSSAAVTVNFFVQAEKNV